MYKTIIFFIILAQALIFGEHDDRHDTPVVVQGILDLSNWDLNEHEMIPLVGEWEFYWEEFVDPESFLNGTNPSPDAIVQVPSPWNGEVIQGKTIDGNGYATYRLKIVANSFPELLSINMPGISTAYDLFIDGEKLFSAGSIGKSKDHMIPSYHPRVVDFETKNNELDIVLHISNFNHRKGGFWEEAVLGKRSDIWTKQTLALIIGVFVGGVLLLNGLYHMSMYPIRSYTKAPFYFGLFSMTLGIRSLITGYIPLQYLIGVIPWWLLIRMEFLTVYLGMPLFIHYLQAVFIEDKLPKIFYGILTGFAVLTLSVFILPTSIFTKGLNLFLVLGIASVVYGLTILFWAIKNKREGAKIFLFATLILIVAFINDLLVAYDIIYTGYMIPYGLIVFIMIQAMMLAFRLTIAFKTVDHQREELIVHRDHLEELVGERTEKLIESNTMKELLLDIITHDLKNPAGVIHGMSNLLIKDKPEDEMLGAIHSSSDNLLKVIQNATTLSKITIGDQVEKESLDLVQMMKDAANEFSNSIKNANMIIDYELPEKMFIRANSILIEVFKNYISNAIKYARDGGKILLKISWDIETITASIIDYGTAIPEEARDKVFIRSLQLSIENKGRGLGLAIVKRIAKVHDSQVGVKPAETGGNEFYIKIPVAGKSTK